MQYRIKTDKMKELENFGYQKDEYNYVKLLRCCAIVIGGVNNNILKFDGDDGALSIEFYISDLIKADMVEEVCNEGIK